MSVKDSLTKTIAAQPGVKPEEAAKLAAEKAASLWRGAALIGVGAVVAASGFALVVIHLIKIEGKPNVAYLLFAGFFAVIGLLVLLGGANIMSGEAVDHALGQLGSVGKVAGRVVKAVRGKNGAT